RQTMPAMTFVRSQTFPFRGKNTSMTDLRGYEQFSYAYNAQLQYNDEKVLVNPAINNGNFSKNSRGGLKQGLNIAAPLKISEFNLSPYFNYTEVWYNKSVIKEFNPADSTVNTIDVTGFKTFRFFNSGLTLNTRLIGLFKTNFFGVKGFRHTITPAVTYNFQPDFSNPGWNAYGSYINQFGKEVRYSYYEKEIFSGAPSGEQQALNFSVGNVFEMKVKDSDTTENKFQLLNVNAGIAYNFAADSIKFSELGLNYRTQLGNLLNIAGGASFNLYKYVDGIGRVNKLLWNEDKKLVQLTNFNLSLSTTLNGGQISTGSDSTLEQQEASETSTYGSEYSGIYGDVPVDFSIPWSVTFNYNYTINQSNPAVISKFSNISGNLNFNLTKNWKFTFSTGYDIFLHQFSTPYITIYRDLHCWEMNFNWVPTGIYRGFRFELRIKASQLRDIKVTKQTNFRGVF
ncbi:MAG: putative LPS assembly protein LptD, partial [Ignavibacteria bacterium]